MWKLKYWIKDKSLRNTNSLAFRQKCIRRQMVVVQETLSGRIKMCVLRWCAPVDCIMILDEFENFALLFNNNKYFSQTHSA